MLRGSTNDTGVGDKIVVNVKNGTNGIKQIFILTHNVYFFKEVTFKGGGNNQRVLIHYLLQYFGRP